MKFVKFVGILLIELVFVVSINWLFMFFFVVIVDMFIGIFIFKFRIVCGFSFVVEWCVIILWLFNGSGLIFLSGIWICFEKVGLYCVFLVWKWFFGFEIIIWLIKIFGILIFLGLSDFFFVIDFIWVIIILFEFWIVCVIGKIFICKFFFFNVKFLNLLVIVLWMSVIWIGKFG